MDLNVSNTAKQYKKRRQWNSTWKKITMVLASIVVFVTTYALILPAITMEPEYVCGYEAHLHSDICYQAPETTAVATLICDQSSLSIHEHTTDCYDENGESKCGIADFVLHTHNSDCYDANGELMCMLPEIKAHTHDAFCWQQPHVHMDTCYVRQRGERLCTLEEGSVHTHLDTCYTRQDQLICTLTETAPHTHTTEACYEETKTLLCSVHEDEGHAHDADCLAEDGTMTCTLAETTGHLHSETCYSAPVYTLTCTTEETEGHTHSLDCYETVGVVTCALEEKIAHVHSDACFVCTPVLQCLELTAEDGAVPVLNCEEKEMFLHTHESACFDETGACICGHLQVSEHIHDETCFVITREPATTPVLACGYEEHKHSEVCIAKEETDGILTGDALIADGYYCGVAEHSHKPEYNCFAEDGTPMCTMTEHTHTPACGVPPGDLEADLETDLHWEATLPRLTGNPADDLIAVAESQAWLLPEPTELHCSGRWQDAALQPLCSMVG